MTPDARRHLRTLGILRASAGLLLILLVLPLLRLVGVTNFPPRQWLLFLGATLLVQAVLLLAVRLRWDERLRWDPHFLFVPMVVAAVLMDSYVLLAPELRQLILVTWFVALLFVVGLAGFLPVVLLTAVMAFGYLAAIGGLQARGFPLSPAFETTYAAAVLVCGVYAGVVFERLRRERTETKALRKRLAELAATDPLTGLPNRRQFEAQLAIEITRVHRRGESCVLAMVDVDFFKNYNDVLGHPAGDALLRELATLMRSQLRALDVVARYGGEEFGIIMPATNAAQAALTLERIRRSVAEHPFAHREVQPGAALTISGGFAVCPGDAAAIDALVLRADEALYRAKGLGRNRVESAAVRPSGERTPPPAA